MATRRESVVLSLTDNLTPGMVKAAAATGLLERALKSLDGTTVNVHQSVSESATGIDSLSRSSRDADGSINQLTGRLRVLSEVAAILAPTLAPVGGVLIAGVGGLANQMGIAAVAGGVLIGSLQGVGDALGAMNTAQLDPTEKNLEKAKQALQSLSPEARKFTYEMFRLKPALTALRDMGAEQLMPGLTASLENLESLGPRVAGIMQAFGDVLGDIAEDSSASLASERWAGFFEFIQAEGPATMSALATTVGDLTHGLAELWEAFAPLNNGFSGWLMDVADGFDEWASGLAGTQNFAEFISYIQTTGPQLSDTLGAIANAVIQIVQATAPLATPVLAGLEAAANAIGAIADSDLGTPIMGGVAALALLNRSLAVTASLSKVSLSSGLFAGLGTASGGIKKGAGSIRADFAAMADSLVVFGSNADKAGAAAERMKGRLAKGAGLAGLAVAASGAADGIGLTNTMSLALVGSMAGPVGAAVGAGAGALLDLRSAGMGATEAIQGLDAAINSGDSTVLTDQIRAAKAELADLQDYDFDAGDLWERAQFGFADAFGGPSMDDARAKIRDAEQALKDMAEAEKLAEIRSRGAALELLTQTGANVDLAKWSGKSAEQIKAQAEAIGKAQEAAQQTAESFVTLGESLSDGKVSLGEWIQEMADSAQALRNFTENSRTAAKRGLNDGLIESLQQAGEQGALRMRQLANGTDREIARANAAWRKGQQAMKEYNDYKVPPKKVTADVSRAMQSFREVDTYLSNLNGRRTVTYVDVVTRTGPKGLAVTGQADGGSVPKDNGPYGDRFLYMLAPGEEIISNRFGQADRFRADRAAGRIPGYADGGTTGDKPGKRKAVGGLFVADRTDALEEAIRRLTDVSEKQTSAVERATSETAEWASKMSDVARSTTSGFNTDLFARDSNPWAAGAAGGPLANLTRDINGLNERSALQSQLAAAGLSGDALAALLAQGSNADLSALVASGQATQVAALFNQRAALQGSVGAAAGQAAYGAQYAASAADQRVLAAAAQQTNVQLAGLQGQVAQLERSLAAAADIAGASFGAEIRGEATKGHRTKKARGGPVR